MKILGIIPARYASTRFPGKPLVDIAGMSMVQRVYLQAQKAKSLHKVVVATDDPRICDHVIAFGGNAVMTSANHQTGTDRCIEVIGLPAWKHFDVVINIQGDEPLIDPDQINLLASLLTSELSDLATLVRPLASLNDLLNPSIVKVTIGAHHQATTFSRSPIPFLRNYPRKDWLQNHQFFQHIGIYGYTSRALQKIEGLLPTVNEKAESLEQLRWLDNDMRILTAISDHPSYSVDTPDDLPKVVSIIMNQTPIPH